MIESGHHDPWQSTTLKGLLNKSFKLLKMVEQANVIVLTKIVRVLIDYGHEIRLLRMDEQQQ